VRKLLYGSGLVAALLVPAAAAAQAGAEPGGLLFGAYFNGITLTVGGGEVEHGPGGALLAGYGVSGDVTAYASLAASRAGRDAADGGDYTIGHGDLGVRFSFTSGIPVFFPYANVAVTGNTARAAVAGVDREVQGVGITLGSGASFRFSPATSVEAGLQITLGRFNRATGDGGTLADGIGYRSGRFQVGVAFRP
jgi:hypothetical protein